MVFFAICYGLTPWVMMSLILKTTLIMKNVNALISLGKNQLKNYLTKII
jgi:hypothetical protein